MNNLIDKQTAIDVLEERLQANGYSNVALVSELNRSIGYLMQLPTVDAIPVEWIERYMESVGRIGYVEVMLDDWKAEQWEKENGFDRQK